MEVRPNIYVLCMHKGASTFVAAELFPSIAKLTDQYTTYNLDRLFVDWFTQIKDEIGFEPTNDWKVISKRLELMFKYYPMPKTNGLIGRLYPNHIPAVSQYLQEEFPPRNAKVFVMRRDPRDALVSQYFSHAYSHNPKALETKTKNFGSQRSRIQEIGVKTWLKDTLEDTRYGGVVSEFNSCIDILNSHKNVIDMPYELLINHPRRWLNRFVRAAKLEDIVTDQWYDEMEKNLTPPTEVDKMKHKRRMRPGNWRQYFDDELKSMLDTQIGDRLVQYQYTW